jgi:hypothetical protein
MPAYKSSSEVETSFSDAYGSQIAYETLREISFTRTTGTITICISVYADWMPLQDWMLKRLRTVKVREMYPDVTSQGWEWLASRTIAEVTQSLEWWLDTDESEIYKAIEEAEKLTQELKAKKQQVEQLRKVGKPIPRNVLTFVEFYGNHLG